MCACNQKLSSCSGRKWSNICAHPARALEADLISLSPVSLVYGLILSLLTSWKEALETRSHLIQFCAARSVSSRAERKAIMKLWGFHKTINFIPSPRLAPTSSHSFSDVALNQTLNMAQKRDLVAIKCSTKRKTKSSVYFLNATPHSTTSSRVIPRLYSRTERRAKKGNESNYCNSKHETRKGANLNANRFNGKESDMRCDTK